MVFKIKDTTKLDELFWSRFIQKLCIRLKQLNLVKEYFVGLCATSHPIYIAYPIAINTFLCIPSKIVHVFVGLCIYDYVSVTNGWGP